MRGVLAIIVASTFLGGCRGVPQAAALPKEYKVRAEQLYFVSDFPLAKDHRLVHELTAERRDLCQTLRLPCSSEVITVYLFGEPEAFARFLKQYYPTVPSRRAFFIETDTRLAVYAHWSDRVAEDLRHEIAHGYLHAVVPGIPLWLDEGLAEYFEVPRGHDGLNRPHVALLSEMIRLENWQPDIERLEQLTDASQMEQRHYAEAWAWAYFLLNSGPEGRELLTGYLADVRDRGRAEPMSTRIASRHLEPQRTISEFLLALNEDSIAR